MNLNDDDAFGMDAEPEQPKRDIELTLSATVLLVLFFSLVTVCGLCFIAGYSSGLRSYEHATVQSVQKAVETASSAVKAHTKPKATPPSTTAAHSAPTKSFFSQAKGKWLPKPATEPPATTTANSSSAAPVATAATKNGPVFMVQVAVIPNENDASVLVNALHKRGYSVSSQHDPKDNRFHVRVGPFSSRADAVAMSKKLSHDGYNAVVQ